MRYFWLWLALALCSSAQAQSAPPSSAIISGTTTGKPPTSTTGVEGSYFLDTATGNLYGPKTSGTWPNSPTSTFGSSINPVLNNTLTLTGPSTSIPTNGLYLIPGNSGQSNALPTLALAARDGTPILQILQSAEAGQNDDTTALGYGTLASWMATGSNGPETAIGYRALNGVTTGDHNTAVGAFAMETTLTGAHNTGIGIDALRGVTNPSNAVAVGEHSFTFPTTVANSVGVGLSAGFNLGSSTNDVAIGYAAMQGIAAGTATTGNNVAVGYEALFSIGNVGSPSTGVLNNTAIGYESLVNNTSGFGNTALGYLSGQNITTGSGIVAIGTGAAQTATTGNSNILISADVFSGNTQEGVCVGGTTKCGTTDTAIGYHALSATASDSRGNTAVGAFSLSSSNGTGGSNGRFNAAVGYLSGVTITTGYDNTILGTNVASTTLTTGHDNIIIGTSATIDALSASQANEINIGGLIFGNANSLAAPVPLGGTSPTIDAHANNKSGTVTFGSGALTSGTITFAGSGYGTWNHCRVTPHATLAAFGYSYSLTAITVTATTLTSAVVDYDCDGV